MILEYHRPETLGDALALLAREEPKTVPMGGGTVLAAPSEEQVAVVDLQKLGLNMISAKGSPMKVGAAATLQALLDTPGLPLALTKAIQHEATHNLRQTATAAGTLVAASGRSAFTCVMLALDAQLTLLPGDETVGLGEVLPLRAEKLKGRLITEISFPTNVGLAYEYVARSPADLPIVCVAAAKWKAGRIRVVLGGWGAAPMMVVDGKDENDILPAIEAATLESADAWASAEYRQDVAKTLTERCLEQIV
jgi:CO/xanthine dehydrogenase FAD-binding subunit